MKFSNLSDPEFSDQIHHFGGYGMVQAPIPLTLYSILKTQILIAEPVSTKNLHVVFQ